MGHTHRPLRPPLPPGRPSWAWSCGDSRAFNPLPPSLRSGTLTSPQPPRGPLHPASRPPPRGFSPHFPPRFPSPTEAPHRPHSRGPSGRTPASRRAPDPQPTASPRPAQAPRPLPFPSRPRSRPRPLTRSRRSASRSLRPHTQRPERKRRTSGGAAPLPAGGGARRAAAHAGKAVAKQPRGLRRAKGVIIYRRDLFEEILQHIKTT